ncbi:MAG: PIN domain-containing protein [Oleiphilaceae bacterium]|nr:PIN domain-containing protein [Oleiphilaceae bacterium]
MRIEIDTTAAHFVTLSLQSRNVSVVPVSPVIAELSTRFGNDMSKDPADRRIAATAVIHNAPLVTADRNLLGNDRVETLW